MNSDGIFAVGQTLLPWLAAGGSRGISSTWPSNETGPLLGHHVERGSRRGRRGNPRPSLMDSQVA